MTAHEGSVWEDETLREFFAGLVAGNALTVFLKSKRFQAGMLGKSGGGVVTMYASACDSRVSIVVPSCK